jgi:cation transport regulator ChaC
MRDAELAAVAGLLGVGLSGGIQVGVAWWQDRKDRRAAVRLVEGEMSGLGGFLRRLSTGQEMEELLFRLPEAKVFPQHRDLLARELSRLQWLKVSAAYTQYNTLQMYVNDARETYKMLKRPTPDEHVQAAKQSAGLVARALELAQVQLVPFTSKPGVWLGIRARRQ